VSRHAISYLSSGDLGAVGKGGGKADTAGVGLIILESTFKRRNGQDLLLQRLWHVPMLSSELKARSQKLIKEQAEQAERTRRKAEAERIAKQRQQRRLAEAEEQARLQRLAASQRAEQANIPPAQPPFPVEMGSVASAPGFRRNAVVMVEASSRRRLCC